VKKGLRRGRIAWINWVTLFLLMVGAVTGVGCGGPTPEVATPSPTSLPPEVPSATPSPSPLPTETPSPITTPTANLGKLAYVKGGDIWVKTLPDGEPQRLTTDARNSDPRWSPSGEWLAFRKGEFKQVWVMRADGSDARSLMAVPDGAFAWAPGEDRLAYVWGEEDLQAINADGTDQAVLVPQSLSERIGHIAWSPDGAWIAYEWREQPPGQPPTYQGLWKVSADGKERVELYTGGSAEIGSPLLVGWTSDGRFLLLQSDMGSASLLADGSPLYALPADGGALVQLAGAVLAYSDFVVPEPTRTDRVAVVVGGGRGAWTNKVLHVIPASTGEGMPLTSLGQAVSSPAWSPDGRYIAYVAMSDRGDDLLAGGEPARQGLMQRRLWAINVQGKPRAQQLTDDPAYRDERPVWAADGSYILFARLDLEDRASLWLISAEGGDPRQVVDELTPSPGWFGYYGHVEWDGLYDWWRGLAGQQVQPEATTVVPAPTSTTPTFADWKTYSNPTFNVTLKYPVDWQHMPEYGERYGGADGFFEVSPAFSPELTVDEACELEANHRLKPYGSQPQVERLQVQGQEACLIWPSDDQVKDMRGQAALIVRYPEPVQIAGDVYGYFVLWADKNHIREIGKELRFVMPS